MESSTSSGFQTSISSVYISGCTEPDSPTLSRSGRDHYDGDVNIARHQMKNGDSVSEDGQFPSKIVPRPPPSIGRDLERNIDGIPADTIVQPCPQREPHEVELRSEQSLDSPRLQRIQDDLVVAGWIVIFAIWGALARITCSELSSF